MLFLTDNESKNLGAFVKNPFTDYNRSKEHFTNHAKTKYHSQCMERASTVRSQLANPMFRIDVNINANAQNNIKQNKHILPSIVEAVMLCAKQQIALRGHRDDRIDFSEPAASNEGNFLALIRLLAEHDDHLKEHLVNGPKNACYDSKTVQDEIIRIAANLIRDYFRQCLELCPHFTVIADETNSQGRQILSVCIRLLDFLVDDLTPKKRSPY